MRLYQNLYLGPNAAVNIDKIRKKAAEEKRMAGVYYISLASTPGNLLDIFHNGMLSQPLFSSVQCKDIVGVAEGKMEAVRLTETILKDIYDQTGGFDVRSYFKEQDFVTD